MIGFIGVGNMASSILIGALKQNFLTENDVMIYDINQEQINKITNHYHVNIAQDVEMLVNKCNIIMLGIKPYQIDDFFKQYQICFKNKALISIALGYDFEKYNEILDLSTRHIFVMPNTPCLVGEGMSLIEEKHNLTSTEFQFVEGLFQSVGKTEVLPSHLMNIGGCISGCSPAYIYMLIEAMADIGVTHGLNRDMAYKLASQTIKGAGTMQLETDLHPAILKDQVCSPLGSTILGVNELEKQKFRYAIMAAIDKAYHH